MKSKALIYPLIVLALLYLLREVHYYGLLKQKQGYYAKYNTAFLQKNNFEILILGSSRAQMHYNTVLIQNKFKKSCFNLSLTGAAPPHCYAALRAYLKNSSAPKYLFYEVDYHALHINVDFIRDFNNYFPYLKNEVLREGFQRIDNRMNHFYLNPAYSFPYTGFKNLSTSLHGYFNIPNKTDSLFFNGYTKEVFRPQLNFIHYPKFYGYIHPINRSYLDSIITLCDKNKIKLTLVSSPIFAGGELDLLNKSQVLNHLNNIAYLNKIEYLDLSSLPFCDKRALFLDHHHLNYQGSVMFTKHFITKMNNIVK